MNWDAAGAIGEIVGAAAVVVTLFFLFVRRLMNPFDTAVSQYLAGALDEHQFDRYRGWTKWLVNTPGGQAYMAAGNTMVTKEAARLLDLQDAG